MIQALKYTLLHGADPQALTNLNAVLQAHRCGDLQVIDGKVTLWFAGQKKLEPTDERVVTPYFLTDRIHQWHTEHGGGRI